MKEIRRQRRELFEHAIRRDKCPKHVPLYSNMGNWRLLNKGHKLSDLLLDYELQVKMMADFQKEYEYDAYGSYGNRNPVKIALAAQLNEQHMINDEDGSISIKDTHYMREDDYALIIKKGFKQWLLEHYLPRKIVAENADDFERRLDAGMKATLEYFQFNGQLASVVMENGGLGGGKSFIIQPACMIMNWYRGMQGMSVDMRRRRDELKEVLDIIWHETSPYSRILSSTEASAKGGNISSASVLRMSDTIDVSDTEYTCASDHFGTILSNVIMSPLQFEEFIWPYLKKALDYAVENNQTMILYAEADVLRFADYFNSVPKGHLAVFVEMDDVFEVKKAMGDHVTIMGGYPIQYLYYKSVEENIDLCKRIMDEVAYDGAYIYSENKILSHDTDAKPENLKAVLDFFRNQKF